MVGGYCNRVRAQSLSRSWREQLILLMIGFPNYFRLTEKKTTINLVPTLAQVYPRSTHDFHTLPITIDIGSENLKSCNNGISHA